MRNVSRVGHFSALASNIHFSGRNQQLGSSCRYGGCVASVFNDVAHASKEQGSDPTGLGRWAYIRIRGKKIRTDNRAHRHTPAPSFSHDLVVIAAYRPNPPGTGESTVWAQHRVYFNSIGRRVDPREAFVDDLSKEIVKWRNSGCEVILGLDANEDLSAMDYKSFRYKLNQVGLGKQFSRGIL